AKTDAAKHGFEWLLGQNDNDQQQNRIKRRKARRAALDHQKPDQDAKRQQIMQAGLDDILDQRQFHYRRIGIVEVEIWNSGSIPDQPDIGGQQQRDQYRAGQAGYQHAHERDEIIDRAGDNGDRGDGDAGAQQGLQTGGFDPLGQDRHVAAHRFKM